MIAPPITSPCPEAYLVRLWTKTSTPYWPWLWKPAKVLSITVSAPAACAALVMRAMSAMRVTGLVGDSKYTSLVLRSASTRSMPASSSIESMVCVTPSRVSVPRISAIVGP